MGFFSNLINRIKDRQDTPSEIPASAEPLEQDEPPVELEEEQSDPLESFDCKIVQKINLFRAELYDVYSKAQKELVAMGTPAVEPLIIVLKNQNAKIGRLAAECLGEIGDSRAFRPLIETLQEKSGENESYEENELRIAAAKAIGSFKTRGAAESLIKVLEKEGGYIDSAFSVEGACIESLGKIGDPVAIKSLSKYLEGGYYYGKVKPTAIEALGNIQSFEVKDLIVQALATSELNERIHAARTLPIFTGEETLNLLLNAVHGSADLREKLNAFDGINDLAKSERGELYYLNSIVNMIDTLFEARNSVLSYCLSMKCQKEPVHLFGEYSSLIIDAAAPYNRIITESENTANDYGRYSHDTSRSLKAVKQLCRIDSQISTNILHKVMNKKNASVIIQRSGPYETSDTLNFGEQRTLAEKELLRRGGLADCDGVAAYDPSAYLEVHNWEK